MSRLLLGVIADDVTGATDVAGMLARGGLRTLQWLGAPMGSDRAPDDVDALVIALKSRTAPVEQAVAESLSSCAWLRVAGARQIYFKYCSTFDSTARGNIGPVAEGLMQQLQTDFTIACPAYPENGRTIFRGHLFVGDELLSDSGMRHHPLTPMTDSNLVRVLQAQVQGRVGLLRHDDVARGAAKVRERIDGLRQQGVSMAIADAIADQDLSTLAEACADAPLVTAGSGLALGLPAAYARRGWCQPGLRQESLPRPAGAVLLLSGSCSTMSNAQVAQWIEQGGAARKIDPLSLCAGPDELDAALDWVVDALPRGPALVYATANPAEVSRSQRELGADRAGEAVEQAMAHIARRMVDGHGVRRLVVAGGETSGAVVQALGIRRLRIGKAIAPGVPWTYAEERDLLLALKSGNFGGTDFFRQALAMLESSQHE